MAKARQVKATGKDTDGDITSLKGAFGSVTTRQAISDIEAGRARYAVGDSELHVVNRQGKKHLRSAPDRSRRNNLDNLPGA